jgi:hypothetical protein
MASSVPAELLKQLTVASEALNNVSDVFNEQLKIIEEALASYNLGVVAWAPACTVDEVDYDAKGMPVGTFTKHISVGYEKCQGKWCLKVSEYCADYDGHEEWVLKDAPRERRMQAIEGIPNLLARMIEEANKLTAEVSKKTTDARVLAASLKPKKAVK